MSAILVNPYLLVFSAMRVSRVHAEVLVLAVPAINVSRVHVEVLYSPT